MRNPKPEEEKIIKDKINIFSTKTDAVKNIGNLFDQKKKLKQLTIVYLEILRIFLSMKKKNIINQ